MPREVLPGCYWLSRSPRPVHLDGHSFVTSMQNPGASGKSGRWWGNWAAPRSGCGNGWRRTCTTTSRSSWRSAGCGCRPSNMQVVGEAAYGQAAVEQALSLRPEIRRRPNSCRGRRSRWGIARGVGLHHRGRAVLGAGGAHPADAGGAALFAASATVRWLRILLMDSRR